MSIAPDIAEADRANVNARGAERFRGLLNAIVSRLGAGKSVLRETFPVARESNVAGAAHRNGHDEFEIAEAAHD